MSNNITPEYHIVVHADGRITYPPSYGWVIECLVDDRWEYASRFGTDEKLANEVLRKCEKTNPGEFRLVEATAERHAEVETVANCGNCAWRKPYATGRVFCRLEPPRQFSGYPIFPVSHDCGKHFMEGVNHGVEA